jgi:hypothetical protein
VTCTLEAPCSGGWLIEDRSFLTDALAYGVRVRRFHCPAGHSIYVGDVMQPINRRNGHHKQKHGPYPRRRSQYAEAEAEAVEA